MSCQLSETVVGDAVVNVFGDVELAWEALLSSPRKRERAWERERDGERERKRERERERMREKESGRERDSGLMGTARFHFEMFSGQ